ncbi:MAG: sarcosine oxidase subunit gamma [Sphingomonadales bacterium]
MPDFTPAPAPAFADRLGALRYADADSKLILSEPTGLAIAAVVARRDHAARMVAGLEALVGAPVRDGPFCSGGAGRFVVGTGPGSWLLLLEKPDPKWIEDLRARLSGAGAPADQSGAYALLSVAGSMARTFLSRGVAIDLHPDVFGEGSAAATVVAHIGTIVWRKPAAKAFEVAVPRSYALSFWHWVETTAASLGVAPARLQASAPLDFEPAREASLGS